MWLRNLPDAELASVPVGDAGDPDQPEHAGQPARETRLPPWPHPPLRPHHDRPGTGTDHFFLPHRVQVRMVLQQLP